MEHKISINCGIIFMKILIKVTITSINDKEMLL